MVVAIDENCTNMEMYEFLGLGSRLTLPSYQPGMFSVKNMAG